MGFSRDEEPVTRSGGEDAFRFEVSVVLPCLNEEATIGVCLDKIQAVFRERKIRGEMIVVDNGSTDRSVAIVEARGPDVRLFFEPRRGYGSALRRGIQEARGRFVIMGDADDTYDFLEIPAFIDRLREGCDLVIGSRFRGTILPGAMSWSHRHIGNPLLSGLLRVLFGGTVSDAHCGLRGFRREAYDLMGLSTSGMEFASEMVIHALKKRLRIAEVPVTYKPRKGVSKLSGLRDAWRHIRFMLIYSPAHLFIIPGLVIFLASLALTIRLGFGPIRLFGRSWDIHVMVLTTISTFLGWEIINLGLAAKVFARRISLEESRFTKGLLSAVTLERGILFGLALILMGLAVFAYVFWIWARSDFGSLTQVKPLLLSLTFIVMGVQTIFTSFFASLLQIEYR